MVDKVKQGDAFARAVAKLAMEMRIEPGHAIQCFGKVGAMLIDYEVRCGHIDADEALAFVRNAFDAGASAHMAARVAQ